MHPEVVRLGKVVQDLSLLHGLTSISLQKELLGTDPCLIAEFALKFWCLSLKKENCDMFRWLEIFITITLLLLSSHWGWAFIALFSFWGTVVQALNILYNIHLLACIWLVIANRSRPYGRKKCEEKLLFHTYGYCNSWCPHCKRLRVSVIIW